MGSHAAPADHLTLCPHIYPAIKHWFHRWLCMGYHTAPADHLTLHLQISHLNGNFTDSCSDSSFFVSTLRVHHLAVKFLFHSYSDYHLADHILAYPLSNGNFTNSCSTLKAHIWQTKCWQINPPTIWQFHRLLLWQLIFHSYSESILKAHIWQTKCWQINPPIKIAILQIAALTAHISFLLWELNIWHTRSWQIYPPSNDNFHRFLLYSESLYLSDKVLADQPPSYGNFTDCCSDSSYFIPILRAQHLAGRSTPPHQWQFHRFLLYPERSYLADQVLADLPPHQMAIPQIPVKFLFHSYSKSSTFGWPACWQIYPP